MPRLDTKKEWLEYAKLHQEKLHTFVWNWHPGEISSLSEIDLNDFEITAPGTEIACGLVREEI